MTPMPDNPTYVIVFDYQGAHQRFWSGKRPVTEYPDAEVYRTFGKARSACRKASAYLKDQAAKVVENYGLVSERVAMDADQEPDGRSYPGKPSNPIVELFDAFGPARGVRRG